MCFQVQLGIKHNELLLQAFRINTSVVVFSEMLLERVVVNIILLLSPAVSPVTKVTSFMLVPTMGVELIVSVEALSAETAFRMTLEPALIYRSWVIIAELLMPP